MCPPYHDWGDEDFDFGALYKAEKWIEKFYYRATKHHMITKEKYGTIRYEYEYLWLKGKRSNVMFLEILYRATRKFPDYAGEIVSDIVPCIDAKDVISGWYKGYFEAILWLKHKSEWK
jgi:hypothetical protein